MLDEEQLGDYIDARFTRRLFRLETHDFLDVGSDGDDFQRYLAGQPGPDMARKNAWLDVLRSEVAQGKYTYRVHVVRSPLTDYLRFDFEWGYVHNEEAGERIGILDLAERDAPSELINHDFWLIDDEHLVLMHYDDRGRFTGAEPVDDVNELARYQACAQAAWSAAQPFGDYWRGHPDAWRDSHHAA
ncbi:DUF6879 family protein [Amycolatopsis sp. TNS106]|uniref:DUF6879 family protein n=1 Tax=Amycolatopsis sp. TNS106 TaxID=2861750 RepID=UPI001C582349|nr:DUF6879 family protein [Amycolatopsis sp. TNS106]QXV63508.1 hypothetical protein CVV72_40830 [Amycolatopsis sp. TNS106]